jgi:polygalacturonase
MRPFVLSMAIPAIAFTTTLLAQDTRTVVEPVIPPFCAKLEAHLTSINDGQYNTLAAADESKLDTERIQKAIDFCGKGKAVALEAHGTTDAFLSGPLQLREGVTLVVDKGATLFESIDPQVLETSPGSCGVVDSAPGRGCKPLIMADHVSGAGVMGDGVIDGRGGEKILGKDVTPWQLGQRAVAGGSQKVSRLIVADHADNFTLYRITLKNSPNFHVSYNGGNGFTVWGVKIDTPHRFPNAAEPLARNTDGVDPGGGAKNITITHSYFREGDDNVAIKGGGPGELTNMTISHNHFYWGHGMSIGSETNGGVSKIRVFDLSLDGTDSGIRIKSTGARGGLVHDIVYDDVCIRDSGRPIDISAAYAANGPVKGNSPPTFRDITLHNVRVSGGGKILLDGYDPDHRVQVLFDGVYLSDASSPATPYTYTFDHADVTFGPGGSNLQIPAGTDATLTGKPSGGLAASCADKFVPFPVTQTGR